MKNKLVTTVFMSVLIAGIPSLGFSEVNTAASTMSPNGMVNPMGRSSWDPITEMQRIQNEINQVFKEDFSREMKDESMLLHGKNNFGVNVSMWETKTHLIISADLPGMNKKDINVELKDRLLTISGQRKKEMRTENEKVFREEQSFGSFSSAMTLPEYVDTRDINAEYKNGVLTITMPRMELAIRSESMGMKIPIK